MKQYLEMMAHVLEYGTYKEDRTRTGTLSVFGYQTRFDLSQGFPLVTTKKLHFKSVVHELLWFLRGDTNTKYLHDHNVTIWDQWADPNGELGPVYGYLWRSWPNPDGTYTDQIQSLVEQIKREPFSRRHLVTAYHPALAEKQALPPCHVLFQFYVADGRLSCQLYQRSADVFLGVPFNIASYSLLTHMVAQQCSLGVGDFVWTGGDVHLYVNHLPQAKIQLEREPLPLPTLGLKHKPQSIIDYQYDDVELLDYRHHPALKAPVAV